MVFFFSGQKPVNLLSLPNRFFGTQDFPDLNLGIQDFKAAPLWVSADVVSLRVFLHQDSVFSNEIRSQEMFVG